MRRRSALFVSIPFIAGQWSLLKYCRLPPCLAYLVSIPFIAGQWSLLDRLGAELLSYLDVSIPFIAGQWSLRRVPRRAVRMADVSIPFIAGQWSLRRRCSSPPLRSPRFNPLHCGAVVASLQGVRLSLAWGSMFQSPSLRGSGRFFSPVRLGDYYRSVSIPFIAGQWSLHYTRYTRCFPFYFVSIPFIAGQWSLRMGRQPFRAQVPEFQSPSLRGSGRFGRPLLVGSPKEGVFQSPSLRGSGRFRFACRAPRAPSSCFNPLHCGAVVASSCTDRRRPR